MFNIWKGQGHHGVLKVNFTLYLSWKSNCSACTKSTSTFILLLPSCLHLHPGYLFSYLQHLTLPGNSNILNQLQSVHNNFYCIFLTHRTTLLITTFLCQIGIFTTAINGTPNQSKGIFI